MRLSGDPYFDIKGLNDEEQLVTEKGYTEWSFTVLPLKKGHWPLHLLITAIIRTPFGTEKVKDYPVKDEIVEVQVTAFNAALFFVGDNWQWLATAVVIPLGIWLWKQRTGTKKRKRSPAAHHSVKTSSPTIHPIRSASSSTAERKRAKGSALGTPVGLDQTARVERESSERDEKSST